jgi:hypothetical protein
MPHASVQSGWCQFYGADLACTCAETLEGIGVVLILQSAARWKDLERSMPAGTSGIQG